jgi:hypothetical protein
VFQVSVRVKERANGVITSTHFTCFFGPIFFSPPPYFNQSNFEARSTGEQRNEKETMEGERNSIFFFIPFSF